MKLFVNDILKKEDPNHLDISTALYPLTETLGTNLDYEVRLEKSSVEWVSARWDFSVGISLKYKPNSSSQVINDSELFISQKRAIFLFQHYSKGFSIDSSIRWRMNEHTFSLKSVLINYRGVLEKLFLILTIGTIVFTLFRYNAYAENITLNEYIGNNLNLFALFLIFGGFWGIMQSYIYYIYKNEIEDDINASDSFFLYSSFFTILGTIMLIANWFY